MTPPCPHGSADPHMCPDCRTERLSGRPVTPLADVVTLLTEATGPAPMLEQDHPDHAKTLAADLQHLCGRIGWSAIPTEDLRALVRSAVYGVPPHTDVIMRASEALAEAPELYVISSNAVPPDANSDDHGGNSTMLTSLPPD